MGRCRDGHNRLVLLVPAFVWRGGLLSRGLLIGGAVGVCLGALAWLDSGLLLAGLLVLAILAVFYGIWVPRRTQRYWPGARHLSGGDRVAVVRAARTGERIENPALAQPVIDYTQGLRTAVEEGRSLRWLLAFILVVAVATAAWDAAFGSWGNLVVSAIYLAALVAEVFWYPRRRHRLLANADRAADFAEHIKSADQHPDAE